MAWRAILLCLLMACSGSEESAPPPPDGSAPTDARASDEPGDASVPSDASIPAQRRIWLALGDDLPPAVSATVARLLAQVPGSDVRAYQGATEGTVLAVGDHALSRAVIADAELEALAPEGFVTRRGTVGSLEVLAARGKPRAVHAHGNLGAAHAAYALLERLGFGFLHPLTPLVPETITLEGDFSASESPRWEERTLHLHTQHPLELTELLQGFGPAGMDDAQGFSAQLAEFDALCTWLVANRQNGIEWFLLWDDSFAAFADSDLRIERLQTLVERAHAHGLAAGIDAPIAFAQQHAFRLLRNQGELADELAEIRMRLDYLARAGWDFYGIEMGTSEFTAPAAERMLAWMNEATRHAAEAHAAAMFVKVHCSAGQEVEGMVDPVSGGALDFNFLPHYADPRLGVLPHTVQHYGLDDPAPTYGNVDFSRMRAFARKEAGRRRVVFYPETAYWVSFDVDVPLFLPVYAERRLADLRGFARDEEAGALGDGEHAGARLDGQLLFSSGWEWGYWLNDLVAARAAWNPHPELDDEAALARALEPVTRLAGEGRAELARWLVDVMQAEHALLIRGEVLGSVPSDITRRNGQAYLQGWETFDDLAKLAQGRLVLSMTQPDKLGLVDMRNPLHDGPPYSAEVEPLLAAMAERFEALYEQGRALEVTGPLAPYVAELVRGMHMTALRAQQVHGLYDYVDAIYELDPTFRNARLEDARMALDEALGVVAESEAGYRVPPDRITAFRANPTAYGFTYLWTVHTLFYWLRDEAKAIEAPVSPCFRNIIDPVDVALGESGGADLLRVVAALLPEGDALGCVKGPETEPSYPR